MSKTGVSERFKEVARENPWLNDLQPYQKMKIMDMMFDSWFDGTKEGINILSDLKQTTTP